MMSYTFSYTQGEAEGGQEGGREGGGDCSMFYYTSFNMNLPGLSVTFQTTSITGTGEWRAIFYQIQ